ncbi:ABA4-like family protein [Allosphingosinicella sp.]|uniref:ABA4-like family protein n=1 Tax=Allosphingosinicella sp. TaxID=2823234 RepID=UPI002FC1B61A
MIDPQSAFSLAGLAAMAGWLGLILSLFLPTVRKPVWRSTGLVIPSLFAVAYIVLIAEGLAVAKGGGFGSIAEVRALFANDAALAAGWLHYLAFDLFVGTWIARRGIAEGVPVLLIIPCFALTFLVGPAGLLLFLVVRFALPARPNLETANG